MASQNRKSFLMYEPTNFSLTDGTNIPPPQDSPPPTANGFKATSQTPAQLNGDSSAHKKSSDEAVRKDSFRSPTSPSVVSQSVPARPQSVRRLFSLTSLRSSFSSSRNSLAIPREDEHDYAQESAKRPLSPGASVATSASTQARPQSRSSKKGGRWFSRKSSAWSQNGDSGLESIGEDGQSVGRDTKRLRDRSPAPLLPEINTLSGGSLNNGAVDWDEQLFKR